MQNYGSSITKERLRDGEHFMRKTRAGDSWMRLGLDVVQLREDGVMDKRQSPSNPASLLGLMRATAGSNDIHRQRRQNRLNR